MVGNGRPTEPIAKIIERHGGEIRTGPFGTALNAREYTATGTPVVAVRDIGYGRLELDEKTPRVPDDVVERLSIYKLEVGDILFGRKGAVDRAALVQDDQAGWLMGSDCIRLRLPSAVDNRFVNYCFQSRAHKAWMEQQATGSTMPSLNQKIIERIPIQLPPLSEQKAIAEILGALDAKIELNRRMNLALESLARTLFKSWFVDFDPVRRNCEGGRVKSETSESSPFSLHSSNFDSLFPDSIEHQNGDLIPSGWTPIPLPEAFDFKEGPGLRNWQYKDDGMHFLNIRCIVNGDLETHRANCISLEEFHEKYEHFALQADDVVISTSGTLGRIAIVREDHLPLMLNTSIIRMRGIAPFRTCFIWCHLQSAYFLDEMLAMASGSVQLNFGPMHLNRMSVPRPGDMILDAFEERAEPLIRRVSANRKESETLAALRDTLLPRLLSGELRIG